MKKFFIIVFFFSIQDFAFASSLEEVSTRTRSLSESIDLMEGLSEERKRCSEMVFGGKACYRKLLKKTERDYSMIKEHRTELLQAVEELLEEDQGFLQRVVSYLKFKKFRLNLDGNGMSTGYLYSELRFGENNKKLSASYVNFAAGSPQTTIYSTPVSFEKKGFKLMAKIKSEDYRSIKLIIDQETKKMQVISYRNSDFSTSIDSEEVQLDF